MDIKIINTVAITSPANPVPRGRPVNRARSLIPDQRERLHAQGYCIQYASPDHWVVDYPLEPYSPRARRASRASPASRASRASRASPTSRTSLASPASRTSPASLANRASPASRTSLASPANRASPASRTSLTNPANYRGADIALLDSINNDLADALSNLSDITENKEILDRLD